MGASQRPDHAGRRGGNQVAGVRATTTRITRWGGRAARAWSWFVRFHYQDRLVVVAGASRLQSGENATRRTRRRCGRAAPATSGRSRWLKIRIGESDCPLRRSACRRETPRSGSRCSRRRQRDHPAALDDRGGVVAGGDKPIGDGLPALFLFFFFLCFSNRRNRCTTRRLAELGTRPSDSTR